MPTVSNPMYGGYANAQMAQAANDIASIFLSRESPNEAAQREAEIAYRGALTSQANASAEKTGLESAGLRDQQAGEADIGTILADPTYNPADPASRRRLGAAMARAKATSKDFGPGIYMGLGNPQDENLTRFLLPILTGQNPSVNTVATAPAAASARANEQDALTQRALAVQALQNQGEMDRERFKAAQPGGGKPPMDISPTDALNLETVIAGALGYPDYATYSAEVSPSARAKLAADASSLYQKNRNAGAAAADVVRANPLTNYDSGVTGWMDGVSDHNPVLRELATQAAPTSAVTAAPGAEMRTYAAPNGRVVKWEEIVATAQNRNKTTDQVIQELGLK